MKLIKFLLIILFSSGLNAFADINLEFEKWKKNFKIIALKNNISENTFDLVMSNTKFLPNVIKYDRFQPEFYEDTKTYINKRTSNKKVSKGANFYNQNLNLIKSIEEKFSIEKELLLSLMGIETNFGTYVGKMDILSSLATLSFDKRRSEFFTKELLILLDLIENKQIDYDENGSINLKTNIDSYASAANYLKQIGWKSNEPCFYRINLSNKIPKKYLNVSAKKLQNKMELKYFKKFINNAENIDTNYDNLKIAIITPDKDIIPDADTLNPAFIVFDNYEIILQWNRSLRFALAVCTLKNKFKNEIQ